MKIEQVQRWVMSSLILLVGSMLCLGLLLGAFLVIDDSRTGGKIGLCVIAVVVAAITISAVRLVHRRGLLTPWLLLALAPLAVGLVLLNA